MANGVRRIRAYEWEAHTAVFRTDVRAGSDRVPPTLPGSPPRCRDTSIPSTPVLSRASTLPRYTEACELPVPNSMTPPACLGSTTEELRRNAAVMAAQAARFGQDSVGRNRLAREAEAGLRVLCRDGDAWWRLPDEQQRAIRDWSLNLRTDADLQRVGDLLERPVQWAKRETRRAAEQGGKSSPAYVARRCLGQEKNPVASVDLGLAVMGLRTPAPRPSLWTRLSGKAPPSPKRDRGVLPTQDKLKEMVRHLRPGDTVEIAHGGQFGLDSMSTPYVNLTMANPGMSIYPDVRATRKKEARIVLRAEANELTLFMASETNHDGHVGAIPYIGFSLPVLLSPGVYLGVSAGGEWSRTKGVTLQARGENRYKAMEKLIERVFDGVAPATNGEEMWDKLATYCANNPDTTVGVRQDSHSQPRVSGHVTGTLYQGTSPLLGSVSARLETQINPSVKASSHETSGFRNKETQRQGRGASVSFELQSALWAPGMPDGNPDTSFGIPGANVFTLHARLAEFGKQTSFVLSQHPDGSYNQKETLRLVEHRRRRSHRAYVNKSSAQQPSLDADVVRSYLDAVGSHGKAPGRWVLPNVLTRVNRMVEVAALSDAGRAKLEALDRECRLRVGDAAASRALNKEFDRKRSMILNDRDNWRVTGYDAYAKTTRKTVSGLNYVLLGQKYKRASYERKVYSTSVPQPARKAFEPQRGSSFSL